MNTAGLEESALQLGEALSEFGIPPLAAALTVVVAGLALFEPIGQRLGGHGASWNPATNACFAAAGKGSPSQHVVRAVSWLCLLLAPTPPVLSSACSGLAACTVKRPICCKWHISGQGCTDIVHGAYQGPVCNSMFSGSH